MGTICLSQVFYPSERDSARILFLINNFSVEFVPFRMRSVTPTPVIAAALSALSYQYEYPFHNPGKMEGISPAISDSASVLRRQTCTDDKTNLN